MNIKEIIMKYKEGNSLDKLGIIGNFVTIITAAITLVTGQLLAFEFVIKETTFIRISFYTATMGLSLLLLFIFLKSLSLFIKTFKSFMLQIAVFLISFAFLSLILTTIWSFVLTIQ
ncbi:MAG: hypothetical protein E6230_15275 [Paenibacillus dendritiformis]|uniref:hypothetical protein n=1 Tax=uncultured Paenibacillus sp. TaxID=227322 RepID=UPI0025D839D0|nr:hypothetical protein [uncultured Paenibacillus sp.]MDU5143539.1 hypothetical protein [Paenibacillus dendritiformis]